MPLLCSKQSQTLRTLVIGLNGIGVIFKLATLDEVDDVGNINQSIWVQELLFCMRVQSYVLLFSIIFSPVFLPSLNVGPRDHALRIL